MLQTIIALAALIFIASAVCQIVTGLVEVIYGLTLMALGCVVYLSAVIVEMLMLPIRLVRKPKKRSKLSLSRSCQIRNRPAQHAQQKLGPVIS